MKSKKICITINEKLQEQLKVMAEKNNISVNAIIRIALSEYFEKHE